MCSIRALSATALLLAAGFSGCSLGGSDEPDRPVLARVGDRPDVRDDLRAITRSRPAPTGRDMRTVLLDGESLAGSGASVLGSQLALLVLDMRERTPSTYARKHGASPERVAASLGQLLGRLAEEIDAALADAPDERRLETTEWGLGVASGFARTYAPGQANGEAVADLALPRDPRPPETSYEQLRAEVAPLLDERPGSDPADHRGVAERLVDGLPGTGGDDVIAAIAAEISERIPARYLTPFLTRYDAHIDR